MGAIGSGLDSAMAESFNATRKRERPCEAPTARTAPARHAGPCFPGSLATTAAAPPPATTSAPHLRGRPPRQRYPDGRRM